MKDVYKSSKYILQFLKSYMILYKNNKFIGNLRYTTFNCLLKGLNTGDVLKVDLTDIKEKYLGIKKNRGVYFLLIDEKTEQFKLYCRDTDFNVNCVLVSELTNFETDIVKIVPNVTKLRVLVDKDALEFENNPIIYIEKHIKILEV